MKYFKYLRKSEEGERQQAQSIETQKRILNDLSMRQSLEVVDTIAESQSASKDLVRPAFAAMLERIRKGDADGLLVAHVDRISRNPDDSAAVSKLFKTGRLVEIRTPSQVYTKENMLQLGIEFVIAEDYSRRLSTRVKEGQQSKFLRGEYAGYAPVGYLNKDGMIYIDPQYSRFIQSAFEQYATGQYSLKQLTNVLYDIGFRTRLSGKKVCKASVHRILRNIIYTGYIKQNGVIAKGIHEPIISKDIFDTVQKVLDGKFVGKAQKHDFLFRGYLTCAVCGCACTATIKKGRLEYYYCTNGRGVCEQHRRYMTRGTVKVMLVDLFQVFSLPRDIADLSFEAYADGMRNSIKNKEVTRQTIQALLQANSDRLSTLLNALLAKRVTEKQYDEKYMELQEEKERLEKQLNGIEGTDVEITLERVRKFKTELCNIASDFEEGDDEVKQEILLSVLWNAKVENGKVLLPQFKLPYSLMENACKTRDFEDLRR
jgi:site-specific DNA recombinase